MADEEEPSASYIHLVHHLIEKCLVYRMTKDECMEALAKHANIQPLVTSTDNTSFLAVWNELEKENKEFFESYAALSSPGANGSSSSSGGKEDTGEMIRKTITDQPSDPSKVSNE